MLKCIRYMANHVREGEIKFEYDNPVHVTALEKGNRCRIAVAELVIKVVHQAHYLPALTHWATGGGNSHSRVAGNYRVATLVWLQRLSGLLWS